MTAKKDVIEVTTDGSGNATVYSTNLTGRIMSIQYIKGNFTDGVDFDISIENTAEIVWDQDNVNASAVVRPVGTVQDSTGVTAVFASGGEAVRDRFFLVKERVKIVVSSGGAAKTGTFVIRVQ